MTSKLKTKFARLRMMAVAAVVAFASAFAVAVPVMADGEEGEEKDNKCVETSIIGDGEVCADEDGSGVRLILDTAVNVLSVGVGILGVVGITIVGIQYLTAGGNEEKTRKAKRRMFEIILGLVAYALSAAFLSWLGVQGSTGGGSGSTPTTDSTPASSRPASGSGATPERM